MSQMFTMCINLMKRGCILFFSFSVVFLWGHIPARFDYEFMAPKTVYADYVVPGKDIERFKSDAKEAERLLKEAGDLLGRNKIDEASINIDRASQIYRTLSLFYISCQSKRQANDYKEDDGACLVQKKIRDDVFVKISNLKISGLKAKNNKLQKSILELKSSLEDLQLEKTQAIDKIDGAMDKLYVALNKLRSDTKEYEDVKSDLNAKIIYSREQIDGLKKSISVLNLENEQLRLDLSRWKIIFAVLAFILFVILAYKMRSLRSDGSTADNSDFVLEYISNSDGLDFKTSLSKDAYLNLSNSIREKNATAFIAAQHELFCYIRTLTGRNKINRASETLIRLEQDILNVLGVDKFILYALSVTPQRLSLISPSATSKEGLLLNACEPRTTMSSAARAQQLATLAEIFQINTTGRPNAEWRFELAHTIWALGYTALCETSQRLTFKGVPPNNERPMGDEFRWSGDGRVVKTIQLPNIRLFEGDKQVYMTPGEGALM